MRALLDASFFIATESGRPLGPTDGVSETAVSVVTLAELTVGDLTADDDTRATRVATLAAVESTWDPMPMDAEVVQVLARIVADLAARQRRIPVLGALVTATALAAQIPVFNHDHDDAAIPDVVVIRT